MGKRNFGKIAIFVLVLTILSSAWGIQSQAANGSVTLSGASGEVGDTVTVSVTIKASAAIGGASAVFTYDPSALKYVSGGSSGGSGSVRYFYDGIGTNKKKVSFSMKFKIKKEGSFQVSCTSVDAVSDTDNPEQMTMTTGSATIKGTVPEREDPIEDDPQEDDPQEDDPQEDEPTENKKSSNTKLSSLKVSPGTLSPKFSPNVRKYTVQVNFDVNEVIISAATKSSKATFYVSGSTDLKEGENIVKVVVTAEDGTTNSYTLTVNKGNVVEDLTIVNVDGVSYTINESFDAEDVPDGFKANKIMYDKAAYDGAMSSDGKIKLFNLKDAEGEEAFFVYDDTRKCFYPFVQIAISKTSMIMLSPVDVTSEAPKGMSATKLLVEGYQWDVWGEKSGQYYLVNARGKDGNEKLYRYDIVDGTYQRFIEVAVEAEKSKAKAIDSILPNSIAAYYDYILIGALGIVAVLIVIIVALAADAEKRRRKRKEKIERWKERRRFDRE